MATPINGFNAALDAAVNLDAFRDEVMRDNPEYTRGIVELILNGFMSNDHDDDFGADYMRECVVNRGRARAVELGL